MDGDICTVTEIMSTIPEDHELIAASVGHALGAKEAVYYLPSSSGEPYMAALPGSIPADCVWNISFD